jgi:hypothetical protein
VVLRVPDPPLAADLVSLRLLGAGDAPAVEAALADPEIGRWFDNCGLAVREVVGYGLLP